VQRSCLYSAASILMSFLFVPVATAEGTPDEFTPAMESICDVYKGAAYGLCNAYCEAMDCDSTSPDASNTACSKVGEKFAQITGEQPPCDSACPFNNENFPLWSEIISGTGNITDCYDDDDIGSLPERTVLGGVSTEVPFPGAFVQCLMTSALDPYICDSDIVGGEDGSGNIPLSSDEYVACRTALQAAINNPGLTCGQ
jgi:hypothetical protein